MELHIRHISGAKAGEEQHLTRPTIKLGRDPSNDVRFDVHRDLLVSGRHAEMTREGDRWVVQDLGSANGTWISGERITRREIHSGDRIEFGQGGPVVEIRFQEARATSNAAFAPAAPGTTVMSVQDLITGKRPAAPAAFSAPAAPVQGGTTVMGMDEIAPTARTPGLPPDFAPTGTKKGRSPIFLALVAILVVMAAGLAVIVLTTGDAPEKASKQTASAAATPTQTPAAAPAGTAASEAKVEQTASTSADLGMTDLERQYRESQAVIDRLQQELAAKNEALANPQIVVKYVPRYITVPAGTKATDAPPPARASEPAASKPAPVQIAAAPEAQPEPSVPQPAVKPEPSAPPQRPAPAPVEPRPAQTYTPQPVVETRPVVPASPPVSRPAPAPAEPPVTKAAPSPAPISQPAPPTQRIAAIKRLKRRMHVVSTPAEFPVPSMPGAFPATVVQALSTGLASTGTILVDRGAPFAVQVEVTNYTVSQKKIETAKAAGLARGLGALAGVSAPKTPGSATSATWDVSLSATLRLVDSRGREIDSTKASAAIRETRSSARIDRVANVGDTASADTPLHDAVRQLVANGLDDLLDRLPRADSAGTVKSFRAGVATLDIGRTVGLAPDDVVEVIDGENGIAQLVVQSVQDSTSTAKLVAGSNDLLGKSVRYLGSPFSGSTAPALTEPVRTVRVARATEGRRGPGRSFEKTATPAPGTTYRQTYVIGPWVRVTGPRGENFWLPTDSVTFE